MEEFWIGNGSEWWISKFRECVSEYMSLFSGVCMSVIITWSCGCWGVRWGSRTWSENTILTCCCRTISITVAAVHNFSSDHMHVSCCSTIYEMTMEDRGEVNSDFCTPAPGQIYLHVCLMNTMSFIRLWWTLLLWGIHHMRSAVLLYPPEGAWLSLNFICGPLSPQALFAHIPDVRTYCGCCSCAQIDHGNRNYNKSTKKRLFDVFPT